MRLPPKKLAVAGGVLAGLAVVGGVAFGPVVRSRVAAEAARRNLVVEVGSVRPGWFAARLLDVQVRPIGSTHIDAHLTEIRIGLMPSGGVADIRIRGGQIVLDGSPADLKRELSPPGQARPDEPASKKKVSIEGETLAVRWSWAGRTLEASGVGFARDASGTKVLASVARVTEGEVALAFGDATADFEDSGVLRGAHVGALEITWTAPAESAPETPAAAPQPPSSAPAAIPASALVRSAKHRAPPRAAPAADLPPPRIPIPNLHGWRAWAQTLAVNAAERIPDGATASVDAFSARVQRGAGSITVGPGPVTVAHRGNRVDVDLTSLAAPGATPLGVHASLPTDEGDATLSLEGGPVTFAVLGVKDGAAGLTDVDRATLAGRGRLVIADDALTFDGEIRVRGAAVRDSRIANDVIRGLDLAVGGRGVLTSSELRLDDFTATLGALHLSASGTLRQTDDAVAASFRFDVPSAGCQSLLESMPSALLPSLRGATYAGTFGARGNFSLDSRSLDDLVLAYDIQDHCRMTEAPAALARERFKQTFTHRIYLPDGSLSEETTGPGTARWVPFGGISPFMIVAILTTEDGGFYRHHGFSHPAIRSSIIANLKARRFVRGASTVSMQLAKNLFLLREKTLSRKLEEVILTDYLEQSFSKDELMELYLNVIEYGPNVYGIGPAAYHYFGRSPTELNLAESLFLSSMLPAPLRLSGLKTSGQLSEGWQRTIVHLMTIAKKYGLISDEELEEGKNEAVVFYKTGPRPPARRHSALDGPDDAQVEEQQTE